MELSISWLVHHMQGRRDVKNPGGTCLCGGHNIAPLLGTKLTYLSKIGGDQTPHPHTFQWSWIMEAYNYTVQLTKKSRNYLLMTAAAGSLVLLCIATGQFEKRSRIFEKIKYLCIINFYFIFIFVVQIVKDQPKWFLSLEYLQGSLSTRSKFGSNSIFALCHFIVGLKSEIE